MSSVQVPDHLLANVLWQIISDQLFPAMVLFNPSDSDEFGKIWLILTNWNELTR